MKTINMNMSTKLKVASFNCRGFKSAADSTSDLFKEVDILAIQSVSTIQTASDRMSAIRITTDLGTILIISVYMPVDYGNEQSVED